MVRTWRPAGVLRPWHARRDTSRTWETPGVPGRWLVSMHGMRLLRHVRGNPDTGLCRSLGVVDSETQQVGLSNRKARRTMVSGESDRLIVLGGWESHPHGEGVDGDA